MSAIECIFQEANLTPELTAIKAKIEQAKGELAIEVLRFFHVELTLQPNGFTYMNNDPNVKAFIDKHYYEILAAINAHRKGEK